MGAFVALRQRVEAALAEVTVAEGMLESALRELRAGPRAEKVTVSWAVENAFARVRSARADLAALRAQVDDDPISPLQRS